MGVERELTRTKQAEAGYKMAHAALNNEELTRLRVEAVEKRLQELERGGIQSLAVEGKDNRDRINGLSDDSERMRGQLDWQKEWLSGIAQSVPARNVGFRGRLKWLFLGR